MPFIPADAARIFNLHGATFRGLAAPSTGSRENSAWIVSISANTPGVPHSVTREEILIGLEGCATARVDEEEFRMEAGCALIVPAGARLELSTGIGEPFSAVVILPVGGQAVVPGQEPFTPPWAA